MLSNRAHTSLLYITLHYTTLDAVGTQLTVKGFKICLNIMFETFDNELYIEGVLGVIECKLNHTVLYNRYYTLRTSITTHRYGPKCYEMLF